MIILEKSFLSFLNDHIYTAASCAKKMEELFYTDVGAAIGRARIFIEEIINSVWEIEKIEGLTNLSLYEKINYLYHNGFINREIYQSLDVIRRAGNDASHNAVFNNMQTAYSVHKEMYKIGVWYFEVYTVGTEPIPPYEPPSLPKNNQNNLSDLVKEQVEAILSGIFQKNSSVISTSQLENESKEKSTEIELELLNGSYLEREISRLRISSAEAVESTLSFSNFKRYLHVRRPIQKKIEQVLETRISNNSSSNLILLCGSVGDGKSHMLSYLKHEKPTLVSQYKIFNDATESFSPSKTAMETLEETLMNFSDQKIDLVEDKVIIAINLGVLHNFIYREHSNYTFNKLKQFVEESKIFSPMIVTDYEQGPFNIISFADYQMYDLTPDGVESEYFSELIKKVCAINEENPFYVAYKKDKEENRLTILHENYEFLCNEFVQAQLVELVIEAIIKFKVSVSSRHFLNFIADLLIPNKSDTSLVYNPYEKLKHTLPTLLFNSNGRSELLDYIRKLSPMNFRSLIVDELLVTLNTLSDWEKLIEKYVKDDISKKWLQPFATDKDNNLIKDSFDQFIESFVAILYLTDKGFANQIQNNTYKKYIEYLYSFNKFQQQKIKEFYRNFRNSIFSWKGSPLSDYIFLEQLDQDLAIAQRLMLIPRTDHLEGLPETKLQSFKPFITVKYEKDRKEEVLDIDYPLFELLEKVSNGYRPNKKDEEDAAAFIEFLDRIMSFGDQKDEIVMNFIAENKKYKLKLDEFNSFVFEKVE